MHLYRIYSLVACAMVKSAGFPRLRARGRERGGYLSRRLIWEPQPGPQFLASTCPYDVIFYGGARGGGKTDCAIGRHIMGALKHGHAWNGLVIRKNYKNFAEIRRRIYELIGAGLPAKLVGGEQQTNYLRFKGGGAVQLAAFQYTQDLMFLQGQQYTEVSIEEGTQFPFFTELVDKCLAAMRSPHGVKCTLFITGNPGGPAHNAVKDMFIRPRPPFEPHTDEIGMTYVYIPAKVYDNLVLCENDPMYVRRLEAIRDPDLRRAWLEGDWDVVAGGFFSDIWNPRLHVLPKFEPPRTWTRGMGLDWGSATPFSVGWYAVSDGGPVEALGNRVIPRGAVVRYAEWYGSAKGQHNTGLRLDSREVARRIKEREKERGEGDVGFHRVADPSVWASDDGPPVAEKMGQEGIVLSKGDRERVAGWDEFRWRLRGDQEGRPMFYVTENCRAFINTVPIMERDDDNWEDVDTEQEDHVADEVRYYLMSRPRRPQRKYEEIQMREDRFDNIALDPYAGY